MLNKELKPFQYKAVSKVRSINPAIINKEKGSFRKRKTTELLKGFYEN